MQSDALEILIAVIIVPWVLVTFRKHSAHNYIFHAMHYTNCDLTKSTAATHKRNCCLFAFGGKKAFRTSKTNDFRM